MAPNLNTLNMSATQIALLTDLRAMLGAAGLLLQIEEESESSLPTIMLEKPFDREEFFYITFGERFNANTGGVDTHFQVYRYTPTGSLNANSSLQLAKCKTKAEHELTLALYASMAADEGSWHWDESVQIYDTALSLCQSLSAPR